MSQSPLCNITHKLINKPGTILGSIQRVVLTVLCDVIHRMGVSSSHSLADLKDNTLLCQLVGPTPVSPDDNFWEELLQFSFSPPTSR